MNYPGKDTGLDSATDDKSRVSTSDGVSETSARATAQQFARATDSLESKTDERVTMMADGTYRTANHAIVEPNSWKNRHTWYAKLYRRIHRRYLKVTLRWPRWVPRAVGVGVLLIIVVNAIFLGLYVSKKDLIIMQGDKLPSAGLIPADGSKYYVADATWQYSGTPVGWTVSGLAGGGGKEYTTNDGACTVKVIEKEVPSGGTTLDQNTSRMMGEYASPISLSRAQVVLPTATIKAAQGERKFEFLRSRYSFNEENYAQVVEIYSRTLGKESFNIIQQCSQGDWDQSQPIRDQLLNNLAVTSR